MTAAGGKAAGLLRLSAFATVPSFSVLGAEWIAAQGDGLPGAIEDVLAKKQLSPPFAVRSSADGEDGAEHSFAGLYSTVLGVDRDQVVQAVLEVWRSADSARVRDYKSARGLAPGRSAVSVVVQEMVDARVSGVAFSRDPADAGRVIVEAVKGIGEELVSGAARPDVYRLDRSTFELLERKHGRQFLETTVDGERRRLGSREVSAPRLTAHEATLLARTVVELEDAFPEAGQGVDVEWAIDAEGLKLLQCRAITTPAAGGRHDQDQTGDAGARAIA
jgi:pyruvate, water dikinase